MKIFLLIGLLLPAALLAQTATLKPAARPRDPSLTPITDTPGLPRVLLIGDSISMGYTIPVRELLAGKANVHRIPENGGSTRTGLEKLGAWLGAGKWDVIHFNWGLHDLKHMNGNKLDLAGEQVTIVPDYEANLRLLVKQLGGTGSKLIWATTTPVPEGSDGRAAGDEVKYNAAAARVMAEAKIPTDDLHAAAAARLAELQRPKNVHFTEAGSRVLAEKVAESIRAQLPK